MFHIALPARATAAYSFPFSWSSVPTSVTVLRENICLPHLAQQNKCSSKTRMIVLSTTPAVSRGPDTVCACIWPPQMSVGFSTLGSVF